MGERTGSRVFQWVWSYVLERGLQEVEDGTGAVLWARREGIRCKRRLLLNEDEL
ncbi:hypothetical protein CLIM01_11646 [Colletotrichum limetticola]|uniref:Uncharacterized protein n=2 Tax=Colletotrichum limetticola TaxID=1209924 RepID=A0ABQ9PKK2_9PEZI|nr:hypothetical protein CLIM01_11646 [Colletotrichum limetticola]